MSYPVTPNQQTYSNIPPVGDPRRTEAWALTEAARRIAEAQRSQNKEAYLVALRINWKLWTIFQADISGMESPLPLEMRGNMLSLCNFVDKHTVDILADPEFAKGDALININRQLASGLFANPEDAAQAAPAQENAAPADFTSIDHKA